MTKKKLYSACYSPRSILSRWFSSLKRSTDPGATSQQRRCEKKGNEGQRKRRKKEREGELVDESLLLRCSTNGPKGESSLLDAEQIATSSEMVESSGRLTKEVSFNLGLGVGLVFLTAATKNEFNKMMELRTQMEMFIKDVKDELKRKDVILKPSESTDHLAYSTTDPQEVGNRNCHLSIQNDVSSHHLVVAETTMECDQYSKCNTPRREKFVAGMNQLEAELEAELERLELHLDTEDSLEHPRRKRIEMVVQNTAPESSLSARFEEVDNPHEADSGEHFGVSPNELERRLHELLEARQKERITELEFSLKCAKHKLHEKEMEVSWWKDTARLISQHVPESMCLSR